MEKYDAKKYPPYGEYLKKRSNDARMEEDCQTVNSHGVLMPAWLADMLSDINFACEQTGQFWKLINDLHDMIWDIPNKDCVIHNQCVIPEIKKCPAGIDNVTNKIFRLLNDFLRDRGQLIANREAAQAKNVFPFKPA